MQPLKRAVMIDQPVDVTSEGRAGATPDAAIAMVPLAALQLVRPAEVARRQLGVRLPIDLSNKLRQIALDRGITIQTIFEALAWDYVRAIEARKGPPSS